MERGNTTLMARLHFIRRLRFARHDNHQQQPDEQPLRAELFSIDQLEKHARALAGWHRVSRRGGRDRLLQRLAQNEIVLRRANELAANAVRLGRRLSHAAEWLLDNFYLIEDQIRLARQHLPKRYSRELPHLVTGALSGYPRVYDIILELISHVDGRVDAGSLSVFIASYQSLQTLQLGELWAVPIMLRLGLIENMRRVASRVAVGRQSRDLAALWADRILETGEKDPTSLVLVLADMVRSSPSLTSAFVAEFVRRLQSHPSAMAFPMTWLEQRLAEAGQTVEQLVQIENQSQAADQVSIANSIGSLRFLASMDWPEFVETMSEVEQTLREDPADVHNDTDFATRDRCRHIVEEIARHSDRSETQVARAAIDLAASRARPGAAPAWESHVGFFLLDEGRDELERAVAARPPWRQRIARLLRRRPLVVFVGAIGLLTLATTAAILTQMARAGAAWWTAAILAPAVLLAMSQFGVTLTNWLVSLACRPKPLPRMDFSEGIPPDCATMVVVPAMLTSADEVDHLIELLEVRFLANRDPHLRFALLSDFADASRETLPGDQALLDRACRGIDALAAKYATQQPDAFYLFHRPRRWNPGEGVWMGWERKRGKLAEFNQYLRGGARNRFSVVMGRLDLLPTIACVITLDSDTMLPRDSARQLVGAMAHPLNRPHFDPAAGRVTRGFAILQPRVAISLPSATQSWYGRLFAGDVGIDPYTREVSDTYQDLFGEGSFIGKGIYDVDVFERALEGHFPENSILSHDLLEGAFARAALISNVVLFEEHPSVYAVDAGRRHRWIRGDWQVSPWLWSQSPRADGRRLPNPTSWLSRWKMLDNLRRSLVPAALLILLLAGLFMPAANGLLVSAAIGVLVLPAALSVAVEALTKQRDIPLPLHVEGLARFTARHLAQAAFALVFLPYEAWVSLDAVIRTIVRMGWTRRRLLEWKTAGEAVASARTDLSGSIRALWPEPVLAIVVGALLALVHPGRLNAAAPLLATWLLSPVIGWLMSRPIRERRLMLRPGEREFLHRIARRTWRYFEQYVVDEHHHLAPDNVQMHPTLMVAHRTSPTNVGLALLGNLAAHDFGYISTARLIDRTAATLATMEKLARFRGHFYNWYDTRTLEPLGRPYVSTVDSGNLIASLILLRRGLLDLKDQLASPRQAVAGLRDVVDVAREAARGRATGDVPGASPEHGPRHDVAARLDRIHAELGAHPTSLAAHHAILQAVANAAASLSVAVGSDAHSELALWIRAIELQCRDALDDVLHLAPWLALSPPRDAQQSAEFRQVLSQLENLMALDAWSRDVTAALATAEAMLASLESSSAPRTGDWFPELRDAVRTASQRAAERSATLDHLAARCHELAEADYDFLFDKARRQMVIGYNVTDHRPDAGYYDLLASEARLCSFIAIAQDKLPQEHWFALGRPMTTSNGAPALLSWSGSMFEYLMPLLFLPSYEGTLLHHTCRAVVRRQIEYGRQRGVPWGTSESGYNATDFNLNYQYRAFGVPGLGLKRGLADDVVIAPYASILALMVDPRAATDNLRRMAADGLLADCGFFEAVDFTPARVPPGKKGVVVRSFMAHHEGMSLAALCNVLLDRRMQRRFETLPMFRATELLLHERVPKAAPAFPHPSEVAESVEAPQEVHDVLRVYNTPHTTAPEVHLLSNGRYHVMLTAAGGGYSRWRDLGVTRWREDPTRDGWGLFCYLRDRADGRFYSTAYQPTLRPAESYEVIFSHAKAEYRRRDGDLDVHTEISVSPEDDIELRSVSLSNLGPQSRLIELTSYAEVILAPPPAEATHPVFNNLFIQTELIAPRHAILCTRRPRAASEKPVWMFHMMVLHGAAVGETTFETDRSAFIGRGRTVVQPLAMSGDLSGAHGSVLDPIVSVRRTVRVSPDESVKFDIVTGVAESREAALALIEKYHDRRLAERVFNLAWTHKKVLLRQLDITESEALLYDRLAGPLLYANALQRAPGSIITRNRRGQSGLWSYGISGDLPIVLLRIGDQSKLDLVRQLVRAHSYWRQNGLSADLLIWNEDQSGYRQNLHDQIMGLIAGGSEAGLIDKPGGLFVRRIEQISDEDKILMQTVARIVLADTAGTLLEQIERRGRTEVRVPRFVPSRAGRSSLPAAVPHERRDLAFFNGLGGFTRDGREYVITTTPSSPTPAPWVNVLANEHFGTVVSESGSAYTWAENAHEFRLTPWHNDPVSDPSGEAFYIRDEESGRFWSPTPLPARAAGPYTTRHGFGYSVFESSDGGIHAEMHVYVAIDAPVKFFAFRIRNASGRPRRLSLTGCVDWVLGEQRTRNLMHVVTELDSRTGALLASNAFNSEFPGRVAFFDVSEPQRTITADRREFLGRNGSPARPAAMDRQRLSGRVGPGLDPCAALQVTFDLADDREREITFTLGAAADLDAARQLIQRFRGAGNARRALEAVWAHWNHALGAVHVETPDPEIDYLVNGWLPYQVLACRMWGRSGFYQSGGAYGFRDQLQDSLALLHAAPHLIRRHLLRCAGRQFPQGDVQHWWHPPLGRGVRTRISDDYLWLPYVASHYVTATGDTGVLDERVHFIDGRPVKPHEDGYYDLPIRSDESATLYEHCVRAIRNGLRFGEHGLPLMGCGDWNDGMNLVGEQGRGESVWLAFFLYDVLARFVPLARARGDTELVEFLNGHAATLRRNIAQHGWDGAWYRRAYFDNGEPLGSAGNPECQIDLLPQAWAILSGAGQPERNRLAMQAADQRLVCRDARLIKLFDPPFDRSHLQPGYVKGYVPGVRENGGQYTHAAVWSVMACAAMPDAARAWEYFSLINPVLHGASAESVQTYKVEPYVVAADVYAAPAHLGRGGWTWYTGSAGWMYRLLTESLLGLHLQVDKLRVAPVLPPGWTSCRIHFRFRETFYHITINNNGAAKPTRVACDGIDCPDGLIPLVDDRADHHADIHLG